MNNQNQNQHEEEEQQQWNDQDQDNPTDNEDDGDADDTDDDDDNNNEHNHHPEEPTPTKISTTTTTTSSTTTTTPPTTVNKFKSHQAEAWMTRYEELLDYRLANGHCLVPNQYEPNLSLAEWVKRQRYQYKLKTQLGKHSSMSTDRIIALEKLGFVWNSHDAIWEERLKELTEYAMEHDGDTNIPSNYEPNKQLAIWIKRQRRQYKYLVDGKTSTMNEYRLEQLNAIDFSWTGRMGKRKDTNPQNNNNHNDHDNSKCNNNDNHHKRMRVNDNDDDSNSNSN